jgi:hypothetical protein
MSGADWKQSDALSAPTYVRTGDEKNDYFNSQLQTHGGGVDGENKEVEDGPVLTGLEDKEVWVREALSDLFQAFNGATAGMSVCVYCV